MQANDGERLRGHDLFGCAAAMAAVLAMASAAEAGTLVLRASSDAVIARYRPGVVLPAGQIMLAAGEWLLVVADGKMQRLDGPVQSLVTSAKPAETSLMVKVADAFRRVDARRVRVGAVRAMIASRPAYLEELSVEWDAIFCAPAVRPTILWRSLNMDDEMHASLEDLGTGERRLLTWPAGEKRMEWPKELRLHDGAFIYSDDTGRKVRLQIRLLPKLEGLELMAALADRECLDQMNRLASPLYLDKAM